MIAAEVELDTVPRVRVDTDASSVWRVEADGSMYPLRGAVTAGVIYDYEAPHDEAVTYTTAVFGGEVSGDVAIPESGVWLYPSSDPSLAVRLNMARGGFPGWSRTS